MNNENSELDILDLIRTLKTGDIDAQISACEKLEGTQDVRVLPALAEIFYRRPENTYLHTVALGIINSFSGETAIPVLLEILQHGVFENYVHEQLEDTIESFGEQVVPELLKLLDKNVSNWRVSISLIQMLGSLRAPAAIPLMKRVLYSDAGLENLETAAWALSRIGTPQAVDVVKEALESEDASVRLAAIWAVRDMKERSSVDKLIELLSDEAEVYSFRRICDEVAVALEKIQTTTSMMAAREWYKRTMSKEDWEAKYLFSAGAATGF